MKKIIFIVLVAAVAASCAKKPEDWSKQSVPELKRGSEAKHPTVYYFLAKKLFVSGKQDEAVKWFYIGQLRFRYHLAANPNLEPSGEPALFASLSEVIGRPLNEYAFGDIPTLAKTLDEVLSWDKSHENSFTPKTLSPEECNEVRAGLEKLKSHILTNQDDIKKQREANGLTNRS
jgi:hypothetical protein